MLESPKNLYIGVMSGTSLDAVDISLVEIDQDHFNPLANLAFDLPQWLRDEIYQLNSPCDNDLDRSQRLSHQLGHFFADCCKALLSKTQINPDQIAAIGLHGQTIRHQPNIKTPYTLQIGDPNIIAEKLNIPVVADFRSRDIAASGQGAPLVPLFHKNLFGTKDANRAVVNIGGIANITLIKNNQIQLGYDTGPGNLLINLWINQTKNKQYDYQGNWARQGKVLTTLLTQMLADPYFELCAPKSTGRDYFNQQWLDQFNLKQWSEVDVMATLTELTAVTIANAIAAELDKVFILGGGAANHYLFERIQTHSPVKVLSSNAIGVDPNFVEAQAFAWLAYRRIQFLCGNEPKATGALGDRVLGAIYSA